MSTVLEKLEAIGKSKLSQLESIGREKEEKFLSQFPDRGVVGEAVEGLKIGFKDYLPMLAAQSIRGGDVHPSQQGPIDRFATRVIEEQKQDLKNNIPSRQVMAGNELHRSLYEGAANTPYSLGLGGAGLIAGTVTGGLAGGMAGAAGDNLSRYVPRCQGRLY